MAYLNTRPVDWGWESLGLGRDMDVVTGPPTKLNRRLAGGELDLSPVSVAAAMDHADDWLVLDNLAIACQGPVGSVLVHAPGEMADLAGRAIAVTGESATSVKLLEVLLRHHWRIEVELVEEHRPAPARLLIGDRALALADSEPEGRIHDLGRAWHELTGLGFVFGVWCLRREFAEQHPDRAAAAYRLLADSRQRAQSNLGRVIEAAAADSGFKAELLTDYYAKLKFDLTAPLLDGWRKFADLAGYDFSKLTFYRPPA